MAFHDFIDLCLCIEKLYFISKPKNVHKCIRVYYTHCIPVTCSGHKSGRGALQMRDTSKYHGSFVKSAQINNINFFKKIMCDLNYYFDNMQSMNLPVGFEENTEMRQFEFSGLTLLSGCCFVAVRHYK